MDVNLATKSVIGGVYEICDQFMHNPKHVFIDKGRVSEVAVELRKAIDERKEFWLGYPEWFEPEVRNKEHIDYMLLAYELLAGSCNYQYWVGRSDVRPRGSCASLMYRILDECFERAGSIHAVNHRTVCEDAGRLFAEQVVNYKLPNTENRIRHSKEVVASMTNGPNPISNMVKDLHKGMLKLEDFLRRLMITYPGYAGDMFVKRPFLVAMMLYRRVKWFEESIATLPIPADYQIPKMLRWLGCISYSEELSNKIANDELIQSGSLMECEIRAASIDACCYLADEALVSPCDVDTYLWLNRKQCSDKFHLTITTDY